MRLRTRDHDVEFPTIKDMNSTNETLLFGRFLICVILSLYYLLLCSFILSYVTNAYYLLTYL